MCPILSDSIYPSLRHTLSSILPYEAIPKHILSKAHMESSDINTEQQLSRGKAHKESETNDMTMQHGTYNGFGREQSGLKLSQTERYSTKCVWNCPHFCTTIKVQFYLKSLYKILCFQCIITHFLIKNK
jgi:hypothetical protein